MQIKRLNLVYFSPTRTTQKVLKAFSESNTFSGVDCIQNDLTYPDFQANFKTIEPGDLVVIGMPVYAGRVPEIAMDRFEKINTNSCPVVLIAVYGNRHYDEALIEMQEMANNKGMKTIAAAAFIGEHSYSTNEYPTAAGRPDQEDIKKAQNFASEVLQKLESLKGENEISTPKLPGIYPLPERRQLPDAFAETNYDKCVKCKKMH
jgi:flavodoxin